MTSRHELTLDDIADVRAYERERDSFRRHVIELKRRRRVHLGQLVTCSFENRDTMRFQIQEMARVEKLTTDARIQVELDTYNRMIPAPGQLCATMFIELTTAEQLRTWLPELAGVERCVALVLPDGDRASVIVDEGQPDVTAAVHSLRWELTPEQVGAFAIGDVRLAIDHPAYLERTVLPEAAHAELLADLRG